MNYIYALCNRDGTIRYTGKGIDAEGRARQHWKCRYEKRSRKNMWLRTLSRPPVVRILAIVEDEEAHFTEMRAIIAATKLFGQKITNIMHGPKPLRVQMPIKAIETRYSGYKFRSRLEARWAVFFDQLELDWEYEPQGYEMNTSAGRIKYLPDFWLENSGQWAEVKGYLDTDGMRRLCAIATELTRCGKGNDLVIFGDVPRQHSILWPVQLHYHGGLWAVAWDPYIVGCPLARPRVAVNETLEMAAHLTDGFPFGRPDWAVDGLERARQARFEWGEKP